MSNQLSFKILHDPDCEAPDLASVVTYASRSRYTLGNKPTDQFEHYSTGKRIESGELIGLPVWAYVHSGQAIKAAASNPYSCPWDSGQSGFAYLTKEKAREVLGVKRLTQAQIAKALALIVSEVETLSAYLNGETFGYIITDEKGEAMDSCWGYIGHDAAEEAAKEAMKGMVAA